MSNPKWLTWAQNLQAIAQNGLTYSENVFDRERYQQIQQLAAEIMSEHTQAEMPEILDLFENQDGYMTPKLDIRGVIFQDNEILLVKERSDGGWTLPGGWVDINEPPSTAVEREVWEESGYQVKAKNLLALYDRNKHGHLPQPTHSYKLYFLCELTGGEAQSSIETTDVGFFALENIPPLSTARTTMPVLERLFSYLDNPDKPTDFD